MPISIQEMVSINIIKLLLHQKRVKNIWIVKSFFENSFTSKSIELKADDTIKYCKSGYIHDALILAIFRE